MLKTSIALIVVLVGSLSYAQLPPCNSLFLNDKIVKLRTTIFKYFHSPPSERRQSVNSELILNYKNGHSNSPSRTANLGEKNIMSPSPELISIFSPPSHIVSFNLPDILKIYAERVLLLKTGDTVKVGDKRFLLGEFLGAGTSTHVFRLAEDPSKAIRIPMRGSFIGHESQYYMREFLHIYELEKISGDVPKIKVHSPMDQYNYAIVDYINAGENGLSFFDRYKALDNPTPNEVKRHKRLVELREKTHYGDLDQFVWNKDTKDWILIDWE